MDLKGAKDRLGFDARRAAMEIEDEFDENRWESQEALKYGGSSLCRFSTSRQSQCAHFASTANLALDPFEAGFLVIICLRPNT